MGGRHGDEDRRVAGDRGCDAPDSRLDLAVPVHVGVVQHRVAPSVHDAVLADLALEEHVDQPAFEVAAATWAWSSSTPEEQEATSEYSLRLCMMSASVGISISPSATAMPRPVVPLDRSIDSWVCSVHTFLPRDFASRMVWIVGNGVLVWT